MKKKSLNFSDVSSKKMEGSTMTTTSSSASMTMKAGLMILSMSSMMACSDTTDCDSDVTTYGDTSTYYCDYDSSDRSTCQDRDVTRSGDVACD